MGTTPHAARDGRASGRGAVKLDIASLRAELEKISDPTPKMQDLSGEELELFMEYWPRKNHEQVAKLFGLNVSTALRIYRRHQQVPSPLDLEIESLR